MSNEATRALMGLICNDTEYADVELVFERGVVLTAHAVVLTSTSDYYKEALSAKWTQQRETTAEVKVEAVEGESISKCAHITKKRRTSANSTGRKIILNHPTVNAEAATIVLDFLYLGDVEIPPSLASSVIAFADEILVFSLVKKCIKYLVKEKNLSPEHALEFYVLCERMQRIESRKSFALSTMLQNLPLSLECGRVILAQMSEREVEMLLLFEQFEPLHRWRILIAWCRASQGTEADLSLESSLHEDFQIEVASKLIEPLLPVVELLKIPAHTGFHLKGTTRSGVNQWKSDVLLLSRTDKYQNLMDIMRAIKKYLPASPHLRDVCPTPMYVGIPGTSTPASFHKACDGKRNTLTLIKLKTGSIFGAFSGVPWSSDSSFHPCTDAFIFLIAASGQFMRLPWENSDNAGILGHPFYEPIFGLKRNLCVLDESLVVTTSKDIFSEFDEGEGCSFIKQLSETGDTSGLIEYYKVYQIR
ncbi:hypothetical protein HDU77_009023 [Chytriomyces hyalinus]|nr:hypothetical protein HDU77_009023 [Chytriomyces hyalinus]